MKPPRDLAKYATAEIAARGLRELADDIERSATAYPLVKWRVSLSNWNPEWAQNRFPGVGEAICTSGESHNARG